MHRTACIENSNNLPQARSARKFASTLQSTEKQLHPPPRHHGQRNRARGHGRKRAKGLRVFSRTENRVFRVGTGAHRHQKYPRRIRNTRERAATRDRRRKCACVRLRREGRARTPITSRVSECESMSTQSQGSSADIWPRGPSPEGPRDKEDLPLFLGGPWAGLYRGLSLARTPARIWYRSSPEWWLDAAGLQAHVTTPPVPFLWYRSQGLTPLPLADRSTFIRAAG